MKFEFAISAGEGTLILHGIGDARIEIPCVEEGETLILAPCDEDCVTGD